MSSNPIQDLIPTEHLTCPDCGSDNISVWVYVSTSFDVKNTSAGARDIDFDDSKVELYTCRDCRCEIWDSEELIGNPKPLGYHNGRPQRQVRRFKQ